MLKMVRIRWDLYANKNIGTVTDGAMEGYRGKLNNLNGISGERTSSRCFCRESSSLLLFSAFSDNNVFFLFL
jgi:hypothetical protein